MSNQDVATAVIDAIIRVIAENRDRITQEVATALASGRADAADAVIHVYVQGPTVERTGARAFATSAIVIGTAPSCHIPVLNARPQHAIIARLGDELWISNLDIDACGVRVAWHPDHAGLTVATAHPLKPGMWVHVGDAAIRID